MATQNTPVFLPGGIPWTKERLQAAVHGVAVNSGHLTERLTTTRSTSGDSDAKSSNHAALRGILELEDVPRGLGKTTSVGPWSSQMREQCLLKLIKLRQEILDLIHCYHKALLSPKYFLFSRETLAALRNSPAHPPPQGSTQGQFLKFPRSSLTQNPSGDFRIHPNFSLSPCPSPPSAKWN